MAMDEVLIECVPNFSEGRDIKTIQSIKESILSVPNVTLLDVDVGHDFNRTVVTMVGTPDSILEAAVKSSKVAYDLIDMRDHQGEHARMGAVDVVPFIPLSNASMELCTEIANKYGKIISKECNIPIYMYGEAAKKPDRINLPNIRKGEYEGFPEKIKDENWRPDYGSTNFNYKSGVTASGSRNILIAYNVNLNTSDKKLANYIAGKIRTSGVFMKNDEGKKIFDDNNDPMKKPGKFEYLQAAGWMFDENIAQVSMNLLNYNHTGLHDVTETIKLEAIKLGLEVISSELVGLIPLDAMLNAGRFYSNNEKNQTENDLVDAAVSGLKLNIIDEFVPHDNIIEWSMKNSRR